MVLLFLKINSFSWSTFSSVLLIDECHKHLESSAEVTSNFNFETQSKTAFFKLSAYKTLLLTCCNTPLLTGIISSIYQLMHTYSWIYIYIYIYTYYCYYLSNVSQLFWCILREKSWHMLRTIYMVIVMLLHWLTSIRYIICGFYNAIYNY